MSVYIDVSTNKMFPTLAELKKFQNQRKQNSSGVSQEKTNEPEKQTKQEIVEQQKEVPVKKGIEVIKTEKEVFEETELPEEPDEFLTNDDMKALLVEWGVDARSYNKKRGDDLYIFYTQKKKELFG